MNSSKGNFNKIPALYSFPVLPKCIPITLKEDNDKIGHPPEPDAV